ncbi:hypothetical protein B0A48_16748 [Cryoendolithus antarcticus]|uniref:Calcineurin-like phosphoesterase domain-containing protein n=1 Tax=Cryoendolithus antarcticus TaxID=1507870 RepID=A0A1V8SDU1_9PEZI|nr:hypothetical protein B0A48_16748 [Cryoendolithus antarcticus]
MHLQQVASHNLQSIARRYPILRQISPTAVLLIFFWVYAIHYGERLVSSNHVKSCNWGSWEKWPTSATPHHLVFIADPQLVDPHTYPGRPWPLSALTESYTDQYMARNFRLINEQLDPDSVVFLGDLLDGGREWSTSKARQLTAHQRKHLTDLGIKAPGTKRSVDTSLSFGQPKVTSDSPLSKRDEDPKAFVHGENGRWRKWGPAQWDHEYDRFGRIFSDPRQLYPRADREAHVASEVLTHPISVENGATEIRTEEYAISGGKTRRVITSLPGNHDLGFGPGVQLTVRDRHETHFGEGNRVDVFGNHTFVSIDAPSLAASSQFEPGGADSTEEQAEARKSIWQPTMSFMGSVQAPVAKATSDYLDDLFPDSRPDGRTLRHGTDSDNTKSGKRTSVQGQAQLPIILLSHVPLYRDPDTDCGRLRERGKAISIRGGYQYQNALTRSLSTKIAQQISIAGEIVHIFSGDDHDYCDVSHRWNLVTGNGKSRLQNIREITVKSFSWAMGVRKPGFLLVSLWNPVNDKGEAIGTAASTVQTHLCLLPDQLGIFLTYAQLAGLTLIILLIRAIVVAIRGSSTLDSEDEDPDIPSRLALIRSRSPDKQPVSLTNGFSTPNKSLSKSRQRAASTSLSSTPAQDSSHLSVQRSHNARTRSVSPYSPSPSNGLVEKAGLYPQVQWADPSDDEESNVGSVGDYGDGDSQGKWKRRPRKRSVARRAWGEFWRGLGVVGAGAGGWYVFMVRTG